MFSIFTIGHVNFVFLASRRSNAAVRFASRKSYEYADYDARRHFYEPLFGRRYTVVSAEGWAWSVIAMRNDGLKSKPYFCFIFAEVVLFALISARISDWRSGRKRAIRESGIGQELRRGYGRGGTVVGWSYLEVRRKLGQNRWRFGHKICEVYRMFSSGNHISVRVRAMFK